MRDGSWSEAVRLTQRSQRAIQIKRFYKNVDIGEAEGGWQLRLDGRAARTPTRNRLIAPTRALGERLVSEWAAQGEALDPVEMPLTRLANSAIDGVANTLVETRADIAAYAGTDLLCYRALEPEGLVAMQAEAFDPVLAWADEALDARFILSASLIHVAQPEPTLAAMRAAIDAYENPIAIAALHGLTSLSGSALLALAAARGAISPEAAWRAAHVDEDFQIRRWGEDEEAMIRRAGRWREFQVAAFVANEFRGG